jgi:glutaminyl-peptide cyclotransferase
MDYMSPLAASAPSDDHSPFLRNGLRRIFYVITRPFPSVWHTTNDDRDCLDLDYIRSFNMLLRVWTAQYLQYTGAAEE